MRAFPKSLLAGALLRRIHNRPGSGDISKAQSTAVINPWQAVTGGQDGAGTPPPPGAMR